MGTSGLLLAAILSLISGIAGAVDLRVMSSNAMREALHELAPQFEKASGHKVAMTFIGSADIMKRLRAGEGGVDVVILQASSVDELAAAGRVLPGSRVDFARSMIGVAVRSGATKPDVSSGEALKRTLLASKSIVISSGPSGIYLSGLFERMGIPREKVVQTKPGVQSGGVVARGEAEIGFQQVSELLPVKGIDYLGPLSPDVQHVTLFSGGMHTAAADPQVARELMRFLASPAAAPILRAKGMEPVTSAHGNNGVPHFQVEPFWPKPLPNRWILGQVSGIATDRYDRIWVVHRPRSLTERERAAEQVPPRGKCCVAAPPVLVFDQSGNLLFSWGGPGPGYEWPESEHGIFVDAADFVWLAGNGRKDGQLLKFTMDGKFVLQIGRQGSGNDSNSTVRLGSPADVAVDVAAREVFAADGYANRRVAVFDSESGAYKRHWGAYGKTPSDEKTPPYDPATPPALQFANPVHCIRLSAEGLIYVCDRSNDRMQIFRKDGSFVSEHVFEKSTRGTGSVYDLVFSPDRAQRLIYMADGMNGEVRIVDRASKNVLASFGRPGRQAGEFTALHNIAVDRQGNLYTSEVNTGQRIQKFRRLDMQE